MPRSYIAQEEEDTAGQRMMRVLRPADDDEAETLTRDSDRAGTANDTAGQLRGRALGEADDDTIGHPLRHISPEPIDAERGLYIVEVDTDEDVTGQVYQV